MELPEHVTQLLESLQQQIKELQKAGAPTEAAKAEEERLLKMRAKSRFQGLGDPIENPNAHRGLKYPGFRFHLDGREIIVERPDQEPTEPGWFKTLAEWHDARMSWSSEPEPAVKVDGRSKAARDAKKVTA